MSSADCTTRSPIGTTVSHYRAVESSAPGTSA
jgi:hypothetical protein